MRAEPEERRAAERSEGGLRPAERSEGGGPPGKPAGAKRKGPRELAPPHETAQWRAYLDLFASGAPVSPLPPRLPCSRAALLIEPRAHPLLEPVARHFASVLAAHGWGLIIAHGSANAEQARAAARRIAPGRVALMDLGVPDLPIPLYNELLKTPPLWRALRERGVAKVLVFQTDSLLLRGGEALEPFAGFDYVGAPWRRGLWAGQDLFPVGNGGLSLRSVAAMLHITERMPNRVAAMGLLNEDYVLARLCKEAGFAVPPPDVAAAFAAETVHHASPCGLHKPHLQYMPPRALTAWLADAAVERFGAGGEECIARAAAEDEGGAEEEEEGTPSEAKAGTPSEAKAGTPSEAKAGTPSEAKASSFAALGAPTSVGGAEIEEAAAWQEEPDADAGTIGEVLG